MAITFKGSKPEPIAAGALWYRSDTDRVYIRAGGVSVDLMSKEELIAIAKSMETAYEDKERT